MPLAPHAEQRQAEQDRETSTCSTSPRANAPITVSGMMPMRNSTAPSPRSAVVVYAAIDDTSAVEDRMQPGAGLERLHDDQRDRQGDDGRELEVEQRPQADASTSFIAPIWAMPTTTVVKTIGAISILTS